MENRESQPKALYLLFFVQMWECFSYYGMRVLLVLYMSSILGFADAKAFGVFAIYCALVECGGIFGGRLADKLLGQKPAIFLGGWLIALGHINMMLGEGEGFLYLSLSLIAVGTGLFSSNVSSLLGMFYEEGDVRREEGYTLFYIGTNLGAILSTLCCGVIADLCGWHAGFGIAALGMLLGNAALFLFSRCLKGKGCAPLPVKNAVKALLVLGISGAVSLCALFITYQEWMMHILPLICLASVVYAGNIIYRSGSVSISKILSLGAYLMILAIFFAAEEQIGGSLLLFSERHSSGSILGIPIPSSVLMGVNPFVIITIGMLVSKAAARFRLSNNIRMMIGCLLASFAFAVLSFSALLGEVPTALIMGVIILISLGELFVGPVVYAYFSESVPQETQGITMGLIPIGYSLASVLSGFMSQTMAVDVESGSIMLYSQGFATLSCLLLFTAAAIFVGNYLLYKNSKEIYGIN